MAEEEIKTIRIIKENIIRNLMRSWKSYIKRMHYLSHQNRKLKPKMIRKIRIRKRKQMKMLRKRTKCLQKKKDVDKLTKKSRSLGRLKREEGLQEF
jgi:hypothetical protein